MCDAIASWLATAMLTWKVHLECVNGFLLNIVLDALAPSSVQCMQRRQGSATDLGCHLWVAQRPRGASQMAARP